MRRFNKVLSGGLQRGEYKRAEDFLDGAPNWMKALFCCPSCGSLNTIGRNHKIAPDGTVSPIVVCPQDSCPFRDYIALDSWGDE